MLAEDMTLVDVAAHYKISKSTLLAALTTYAEDEWKTLQIARAQVAVQRASQKRMEIAAQLDEYQAAEKKGTKTTETALTYPRIREQLRIAEHDEKSAQWHLERLHRRLFGNSMDVHMSANSDDLGLPPMSKLVESNPALKKSMEEDELRRQAEDANPEFTRLYELAKQHEFNEHLRKGYDFDGMAGIASRILLEMKAREDVRPRMEARPPR